jgi:hypothetical protein
VRSEHPSDDRQFVVGKDLCREPALERIRPLRVVLGRPLILLISLALCSPPGAAPSGPTSGPAPIESGNIDLVAPAAEILRFCHVAANQLDRAVPCPTLVPAHWLFPHTEVCTGNDQELGGPGCFRGSAFLMQEVFRGPASYSGMPDSDGSPSNIGHLNIWSSPRRTIDTAGLECKAQRRTVGTTEVDGRPAEWVDCPEKGIPPQDSGHIILEWSEQGIVYAVSLHRDSPVNRGLALTIAQHLVLVKPRNSS